MKELTISLGLLNSFRFEELINITFFEKHFAVKFNVWECPLFHQFRERCSGDFQVFHDLISRQEFIFEHLLNVIG